MPSHSQFITVDGLDANAIRAISYAALENLEWKILFAAENVLVAHTIQTWTRYANEVTIEAADGQYTVTSKMIHGELADISGRTKKDVAAFVAAYEAEKPGYNVTSAEALTEKIQSLETKTIQQAQEEIKEAEEVDKVMKYSKGNTAITYALMAINIIVFILMVVDGAGIMELNSLVHIKWGSNFYLLTKSGDSWRLITNVFIHFGIIHLLMNMYCLYIIGSYLEPMLGKARFICAYVGTGIIASVVSLWWHKEGINSAGASGAVFGMYGLFLALLTTRLIPDAIRKSLLQSTAIFVGYNLIYGMKGGIDNAAHIGGLISGAVVGLLYIISLKKEKEEQPPMKWMAPAVLVLSVAMAYFFLEQNKIPASERTAFLQGMENEKYDDYKEFNKKLSEFDIVHARAQSFYNYPDITNEALRDTIQTVSIKNWNAAEEFLLEAKGMKVSPDSKLKIKKLLEYIQLKKQEMQIILQIIDAGNQQTLEKELKDIRYKASDLFEEAVKL